MSGYVAVDGSVAGGAEQKIRMLSPRDSVKRVWACPDELKCTAMCCGAAQVTAQFFSNERKTNLPNIRAQPSWNDTIAVDEM